MGPPRAVNPGTPLHYLTFGALRNYPLGMRKFVPILFVICCCTYSFTGSFPSKLRRVSVPVFGNQTLMYGIEDRVTSAFIDAITEDGRLQVTSEEGAALRVTGTMTRYKKEPFEYDASGEILTYKVTLTSSIGFVEVATDEHYLEESTYTGWSTYDAESEEESDGIEGAAGNLAQNTLIALFQKGF